MYTKELDLQENKYMLADNFVKLCRNAFNVHKKKVQLNGSLMLQSGSRLLKID
jgi:hypothetical protein